MREDNSTSDAGQGSDFQFIMQGLGENNPANGMVSEQQFLETELANGISLDNPIFVNLGRVTAAQMRVFPDIRSVLDFGAGVGVYSEGFHREGFDILAYEHFAVHRAYIRERLPHIRIVDRPCTTDLLAWIETAEHMTDAEIDRLLTSVAPGYILFSSTSERTEDDELWGHINVKEQHEWVRHLEAYGYTYYMDMPFPTSWTKLFIRVGKEPEKSVAPSTSRAGLAASTVDDIIARYGMERLKSFHRMSSLASSDPGEFLVALRDLLEGKRSALDFDETRYLSGYPDVRAAVEKGDFLCGYEHFCIHGSREGRWPMPGALPGHFDLPLPADFQWVNYLLANIELLMTGICTESMARGHFRSHGIREGRSYLIQDTQQEGGSAKHSPIFLFYHVYCDNDWKDIFQEHMEMVTHSGLLDELDRIYINVVGTGNDLEYIGNQLSGDKYVVCLVPNQYEFATMDLIVNTSKAVDFKGVYIHSKGSSYPSGDWQKSARAFWRHFMNHQVLHHWRECHRLIQRHDLVGTIFRRGNTPTDEYWQSRSEVFDEVSMKYTDHFCGNFFWFDSRYFSRFEPLTSAQKAIRFNAEWLPFRHHPDKCEVYFDLPLWRTRVLALFKESTAMP
jgi:hypothetical protein